MAIPAGNELVIQALGGRPVDVRFRRFAAAFPPPAEKAPVAVPARRTKSIVVSPDRSRAPWQASIASFGAFRVCGR